MKHIIKINVIKHYSLDMTMYCAWTSYMYLACHAPIMDNPENNQHFNEHILVGGRASKN